MAKVLVVEDEPEIAQMVKLQFELEGFAAQVAPGGLEALEMVEEEKPDLIVLDIMMPRVDGWEVLLKLKSQPSTRDIPVIVLSAKGEDISKITAFRIGADDYLVKPFSSEELIVRSKKALGRRERKEREKKEKLEKLPLETEGKVVFLNPAEILFFHSHDFQTDVYLKDKVITTSFSLTDFELKLRGWRFFRTHRSYLVNLDWVKELVYLPNRTCLLLLDDPASTRVPVSRRTVSELKKKLGIF